VPPFSTTEIGKIATNYFNHPVTQIPLFSQEMNGWMDGYHPFLKKVLLLCQTANFVTVALF